MFGLIAIVGHLALGILIVWYHSSSAVRRPLSALCFTHFAWNLAAMAFRVSSLPQWHFLDVACSALVPAEMLHIALAFVGRRRELRVWLFLSYLACAALSIAGLLAFFYESLAAWTYSALWSTMFMAIALPLCLLSAGLLWTHARASGPGPERRRVTAMLLAIALGVLLGLTDVWSDIVVGVPRMSHLGTLLSTAAVAASTLRLRLLDVVYSPRSVALSGFAALLAVGVALLVFHCWGPRLSLIAVGVAAPLAIAAVLLRLGLNTARESSARARQMAFLGRASAQMSHDLRNPLAALKGAIQYLEADLEQREEQEPREDDAGHLRFLRLMADQVVRIERSIERYGRMARTEANAAPEALNQIVERVSALQPFAATGIAIQTCLDARVPTLLLDAELLFPALQNVLQNALEASESGSVITLRTQLVGDRVELSVEDQGCGMDARQCERSVDEFFTTKATGSGLGLTFAKRVAEAHAGTLRVMSKLNHGTSVVFDLPAKSLALVRQLSDP